MKNIIVFLFAFLVISACTRKEEMSSSAMQGKIKYINDYQLEERLIKGVNVFPNMTFNYPYDLVIKDSLMLISDIKEYNGLLSVLNLKSGELIGRYIKSGDGPEELISIATIEISDAGHIFLHDKTGKQVGKLKFDQLLNGDISNLKSEGFKMQIYDEDYPLNLVSFTLLSDSTFVSIIRPFPKKRFLIHNQDLDSLRTFGQYPPTIDKEHNLSEAFINGAVKGVLFLAQMKYSITNEKLIVAYSKVDLIQIYDLKNLETPPINITSKETEIPFPYNVTGTNIGVPCRGCPLGYDSPSLQDSVFYVRNINNKYGERNSFVSNEILKFDYEGNLLGKYVLDEKLYAITIDASGKFLYGINISTENPQILKYAINEN
ncbi:BF3164 family lipoprotein [Marivirga arenosa]|uniref:BF3164 family lipoprotein n=1 Tax=Marivirga arenosa TaxID=3059076 RepID=A0AA51ZUT6_9BACT|nr:BF3164 family lipoprotein [Marivirga sp. BKB1-2]WNB17038.1 BF3164 family lipoprotein [Marivirga sp. BKB1-2]